MLTTAPPPVIHSRMPVGIDEVPGEVPVFPQRNFDPEALRGGIMLGTAGPPPVAVSCALDTRGWYQIRWIVHVHALLHSCLLVCLHRYHHDSYERQWKHMAFSAATNLGPTAAILSGSRLHAPQYRARAAGGRMGFPKEEEGQVRAAFWK